MAATFFDLLGAALVLLPPDTRTKAKEYAPYSLEWAPMAANANKQKASFTVDANADFVGIFATWYATDTAAPPAEILAPQLMFNMNITGGRQVFDKDVHIKNFAGQQATNGFPFAFPLWVARTGTLNGFLTDLANLARNVRITVHGFHIYDRESATNKAGGF
jgi:hypothetical protein